MANYFILRDVPTDLRGPLRFPCPLCRTPCPVRVSKKAKPYFHCEDCLVQVFIRGRTGIARLTQWARQGRPEVLTARPQRTALSAHFRSSIGTPRREVSHIQEKRFSGDYECEKCFTNYTLDGDTSLKCPKCGGHLVEVEDEEEGEEDEKD